MDILPTCVSTPHVYLVLGETRKGHRIDQHKRRRQGDDRRGSKINENEVCLRNPTGKSIILQTNLKINTFLMRKMKSKAMF